MAVAVTRAVADGGMVAMVLGEGSSGVSATGVMVGSRVALGTSRATDGVHAQSMQNVMHQKMMYFGIVLFQSIEV